MDETANKRPLSNVEKRLGGRYKKILNRIWCKCGRGHRNGIVHGDVFNTRNGDNIACSFHG